MKTMTGKELGEKLLRSVRQMQRGEVARATRVKPNVAAKACADVGLSQAEFEECRSPHPSMTLALRSSDTTEVPLFTQSGPVSDVDR